MTVYILGRGPISILLGENLSNFQKTVLVSRNQTPIYKQKIITYTDFNEIEFTESDSFFICWRGLPEKNSELEGVLNLLQKKINKYNVVINLSSVAVYGETFSPAQENTPACPVNKYGQLKLDLELFLSSKLQSQVITLRLSNIFGDYNFDDVVNRIIKATFDKTIVDLYEPNLILRDFLSIDQAVKLIFALFQKSQDIEKRSQFNISAGKSLTLGKIIEIVSTSLKIHPDVRVFDVPEAVITQSLISNEKLTSFLEEKVVNQEITLIEYVKSF